MSKSSVLTIGFLVVLLRAPTSAQPPAAVTTNLPRVFGGAGAAVAGNDAGSRMRLFRDSRAVWLIEAGVSLSSRIGVGVELVQPATITTSTSGMFGTSWGRQRERILLGLIRARVAATDRVALDAVGGAGVMFQHHETRAARCIGCPLMAGGTLENRAPAFAVGADIPWRIARNFAIAGTARCYVLRRGEHVSNVPATLFPWQYEWMSSTRFGVGVSARAGW